MNPNKIYSFYFSATDTTKKVVSEISLKLADLFSAKIETIDFTLPDVRTREIFFEKDSLVIAGVPVYAGRVPNVLLSYLTKMVKSDGALCIPIVLYGNRNYDDALIELRNILEADGLHSITAGAFIGEHSFSKILGANRPDEKDIEAANRLAVIGYERALKLTSLPLEPVYVKGETQIRPYYTPRDRHGMPVNILKVKPKTSDKCTNCGICTEICPMGSINPENVHEYIGICIKCGACIKKCPVGAKYYDDAGYLYHQHELEQQYERRAEPEIF